MGETGKRHPGPVEKETKPEVESLNLWTRDGVDKQFGVFIFPEKVVHASVDEVEASVCVVGNDVREFVGGRNTFFVFC